MTPAKRIREMIQTPLERHPRPQWAVPHDPWWTKGRFLGLRKTTQLSMLDKDGRAQLIAQIVARMRKGKRA